MSESAHVPIRSECAPVKKVQDLVVLVEETRERFPGCKIWFRGQSKSTWNLDPAIFRPDAPTDIENHLCTAFRLEAPARYAGCPPPDEREFDWLSLIRHYELPTRLLDWTESVLVAAYFALDQDNDDDDGAIWVLAPQELNTAAHKEAAGTLLLPGSNIAQRYAERAFSGEQAPLSPVAVVPVALDMRMMLQQSRFTIHGESESLNLRSDCGNFIARSLIPKANRKTFRSQLRAVGVDVRTLFPDLSALAKGLVYEAEEMVRGHM